MSKIILIDDNIQYSYTYSEEGKNQLKEQIMKIYHNNNVVLGEILSQLEIKGLTIEEIVDIYANLYEEIDGYELFLLNEESEVIKKLGTYKSN